MNLKNKSKTTHLILGLCFDALHLYFKVDLQLLF